MSKNFRRPSRTSPIEKSALFHVKFPTPVRSGLLKSAAISGVMMPVTMAVTTAPKAAPRTTATARSIALPRAMKSLNPVRTFFMALPRMTMVTSGSFHDDRTHQGGGPRSGEGRCLVGRDGEQHRWGVVARLVPAAHGWREDQCGACERPARGAVVGRREDVDARPRREERCDRRIGEPHGCHDGARRACDEVTHEE